MGRGRVYERGLEKGNSLEFRLEADDLDDPQSKCPAYDPGREAHDKGLGAKSLDRSPLHAEAHSKEPEREEDLGELFSSAD